jgi:hypothetical protein
MQCSIRISFLLLVLHAHVYAQKAVRTYKEKGDPIINIKANYSYLQTGGNLAERFDNIHNIGFGGLYKTANNWILLADVNYQFTNFVKEPNLLIHLTNSNGFVMNAGGAPALYTVSMRGLSGMVKLGKLIPVSWRNRNSGIMLNLGGGKYYHKIHFVSENNDIPVLTPAYRKGYDRLTSGWAFTQFIGYYHHSHNRFINFYIGFDMMQAFTQSVRKFNYDTMLPDTEKRLDITFGPRVGWMIPIYLQSRNSDDEYEFK